ncbi:MAG: copper resistance protein CopC [Ilumatobacteraceae bacterium]
MKRAGTMALAAMAVLISILSPATAALAHGELLNSEPAASSSLAESPTQISLFFSESIEPVFARIRILNSTGSEIASGNARRDSGDHSVVRSISPHLEPGAYVVVWRVTSADGHPIEGAFEFFIGTQQESASDLEATLLHSYHEDPSVNYVRTLLRWIVYVGVIGLIGSMMMRGMLKRPADLDSRSVMVTFGTWLIAVFGSLMTLVAYGPNATGTNFYNLSLLGQTLRTTYGQATVARLVLLAAIAILIYFRRHISRLVWSASALVLCIGIVATLSLTGHPVVQHPALLSVGIDTVHMSAVSSWIGGIALLSLGGSRWYHENDGYVVRRFSAIATWMVIVIIATGVSQAWLMMDGFSNLFSSDFGRTLLIKTTAVAVLVSLGLLSRRTLKLNGPASVRRVIGTELFVGLVVVAISALLIGTPPRQLQAAEPFTATLVRSSVIANVTITPTRVGLAELHVIVTPPGGALVQVISASARMALQDRDIPNIPIELIRIGPNHFSGTVNIAYPGTWDLEVLIVPSPNMTLLFQTSFGATD